MNSKASVATVESWGKSLEGGPCEEMWTDFGTPMCKFGHQCFLAINTSEVLDNILEGKKVEKRDQSECPLGKKLKKEKS